MLIDKLEKAGRLLLWVTLSTAVILALVGAWVTAKEVKASQIELQTAKDELQKALEPKQPERLTFAGVGAYIGALVTSAGEGRAWFTNVSPKSGHICIVALAQIPSVQGGVSSIAACTEVRPYSAAKIEAQFAVRELVDFCGKDNERGCKLSFVEAQ